MSGWRGALVLLACVALVALTAPGCSRAPKRLLETTVEGASDVLWLAGDSLLAVALLGRGVAIVDAWTGAERSAWRLGTMPARSAHGLAASAHGETLAVATADSVRVLRVRDGVQLMAAPGNAQSLALSSDGRALAWSDGSFGRVLDARDGRVRWQGEMLAGRHGLVWLADGAFAWTQGRQIEFLEDRSSTGAGDDGLRDAATRGLGPFLEERPGQLAPSGSGLTLAVAESTLFVSFWDTRLERMRWRLQLAGGARFEHVALSADTWYLATARAGRARLLWAYTGRAVSEWSPHGGATVRDVAFSHDGRRLATVGADGHVSVWAVPPLRQERL